MQHEFRGATLENALKKVAWDIEAKRTRQPRRKQRSKAQICESRRRHIEGMLDQMQRMSNAISSVSEETMHEIRRATRESNTARLSLAADVAALVVPMGVAIRGIRTLNGAIEAGKKALAAATTGSGVTLALAEGWELYSALDTVSGRLETIRNNRELVEKGRQLSRLSLALSRLQRRLQRVVSAHNSAGC